MNVPTPTRTLKPVTYIWAHCAPSHGESPSTNGGVSSSLRIYSVKKTQAIAIKELGCLETGAAVNAVVYVPRAPGLVTPGIEDRREDQVWVAEADNTIVMYSGLEPEKGREVNKYTIFPNLTGGFYIFFIKKSPHFAVHFIQNNTKLTPPQTSGHHNHMPPL